MVPTLPGCLIVAFFMSTSLTLTASAAAQQPPPASKNWLVGIEILLAAPGQTREKVLKHVEKTLRKYDNNGDGLTAKEVAAFKVEETAKLDARLAAFYAPYDLDSDGSVTLAEAERSLLRKLKKSDAASLDAKSARWFKQKLARLMRLDVNGDKVVAADEMRASVQDAIGRSKMPRNNEITFFFGLDPNKDGRLTFEELVALTDEAFRKYDTNGNGVMDVEETKPLNVRALAAMDKKTHSCKLPKPNADEQVIVLGTHRGAGISTVSVSGPDDVTTTRSVIIEPGEKALYIVLTSKESMIWKFEGETTRISRVIVITRGLGSDTSAGVMGLQAKQVHFAKPRTCPTYTHPGRYPGYHPTEKQKKILQRGAKKNRAKMELVLGGRVDVFVGARRSEIPSLPSGKVSEDPNRREIDAVGLDANARGLYQKLYPGGVDEIDPGKVVAPKPVQPYEVLPGYAGLVQLLRDGAVVRLTKKEYRIVKPISHLPAGFRHGRSVTFRLGKGVPLPKGSLGRTCVFSEESDKQLNKSAKCRKKSP